MRRWPALFVLLAAVVAAQCSSNPDDDSASPPATTAPPIGRPGPGAALAASKIRHVIVIMQENRSFDQYFGTYPGAEGYPTSDGRFTTCVPDPDARACVYPTFDSSDRTAEAPHTEGDAIEDINGGKMDGFINQAEHGQFACGQVIVPTCTGAKGPQVMGWHDARHIPNYWAYAQYFVLQDHMFVPTTSWSLPAHLYMVSAWSARCASKDPMSCVNENAVPPLPPNYPPTPPFYPADTPSPPRPRPVYAWTDLTHLLHERDVPWRYYVQAGEEPDCRNDAADCPPVNQDANTPGIWNPLLYFETVRENQQSANIQDVSNYYRDARLGTLPAVAWITPGGANSEHPPALISDGQAWVTSLVNAAMQGPDWKSTAIFISWDDWGGYYDHVHPPVVDQNGYGIRVPGLMISAYAKKGFIDKQVLSHDAYLKLIQDLYLGGARLDPATDGRPDRRLTVRETATQLGNLLNEFDFNQRPHPPLVLAVKPPPGPASRPD